MINELLGCVQGLQAQIQDLQKQIHGQQQQKKTTKILSQGGNPTAENRAQPPSTNTMIRKKFNPQYSSTPSLHQQPIKHIKLHQYLQ